MDIKAQRKSTFHTIIAHPELIDITHNSSHANENAPVYKAKTDLFQMMRPNVHPKLQRGEFIAAHRKVKSVIISSPTQEIRAATAPNKVPATCLKHGQNNFANSGGAVSKNDLLGRIQSTAEQNSETLQTLHFSHLSTNNGTPLQKEDWKCNRETPRHQEHSECDSKFLPVDPSSREHLEAKACMLARIYRLDVNELVRSREKHRISLAKMRAQRQVSIGCSNSDGYIQESVRRKTQFLLSHYLKMDKLYASRKSQILQHYSFIFPIFVDNRNPI